MSRSKRTATNANRWIPRVYSRRSKQKVRPELIAPYRDELLRLAASLRHGWAPASLLLSRLQAGSRRNPLARALQEYGRLVKTNFILAWLADDQLRKRVGRQPNKGERLHALRRAIFYANEGHVRQRTPEQQAEQALCLTIVCNAIIVWNTVYTQRVLDQLRSDGELITTSEDRADLAPAPPAHPPLRPLPVRPRQPSARPPAAAQSQQDRRAASQDGEPRLTLNV